jgi:hypothetical protein
MAFTSDIGWAKRTAEAILLIRILVGWVSFRKAFRNFCFPIPWESGVSCRSASRGRKSWLPLCRRCRDCLRSLAVDRPDDAALFRDDVPGRAGVTAPSR